MSDQPLDPSLDALRANLLAAVKRARQDRSFRDHDIRLAAQEFGRAARSAQLAPEKLVVSLKEASRAPELAGTGDWFRQVVTSHIIVWAIDAYYGLESD